MRWQSRRAVARRAGHLRRVLAAGGFRRLLATRLVGQFADGLFQASLAGAVLFNPEHQTRAADVAAGFTVLLLPYSLLGPFAGVLLDRWSRQRTLVYANLVRAALVLVVAAEIAAGVTGPGFYASALVAISLSRFVNSALSAALPHVVGGEQLVTANSVAVTCGTLAATLGGALAVGVRALLGGGDRAYAAVAVTAAVPYLVAGGVALGFARAALGPDGTERANRETARQVAAGLRAGARHVWARPAARDALGAIAAHRLGFGLWTVLTVLAYRNYFQPDGPWRAGLGGLTQVVVAIAVGGGVAAFAIPPVARRLGNAAVIAGLLAAAGGVVPAATLPYRPAAAVGGAVLLGFAAQGIKICIDTILQEQVADAFRGRVFAIYDALFNVAMVVAAGATAFALPENGHAPGALVGVGIGYVLAAGAYLVAGRRARSGAVATRAGPAGRAGDHPADVPAGTSAAAP